ncbi:MAG: proton-conducting transporter membrane subunit [Thermomicrobium sp.]|nr:proton-conducting transporter membrane subunit [Thermomicrobium sp.]
MLLSLATLAVLILLAPIAVPRLERRFGYLVALASAASFGCFGTRLPDLFRDGPYSESVPWLPTLGSELALRLDGLSALFALLVTGIGAVVALYTVGYLEDDPRLTRFWVAFLLFELAMLGLVLADDLLVLFVFWELTSVASFFLIGFAHDRPRVRANAQQALVVTGAGGLALLAGFLLLAQEAGPFRLSELSTTARLPVDTPLASAAFALVLLGAITKSAQVPFHFWLPNAMEAPTPVSAYLHSATMVKAGIYLLARLSPLFGSHPWWEPALVALGGTTAVVGALLAVTQRDLKRLLAYSTVAALGTLVLLLGLGAAAAKAFTLFLLAHALYKGGAFLLAGAIEHGTGQRALERLGQLWRHAPPLTASALLVVLAAAGLPPALGFVAKEAVLETGLRSTAPFVTVVLTGSFLGQTAVAWLLLRPFFARRTPEPSLEHPPHWTLLSGPAALGGAALVGGLVVSWIAPLVAAVANSVTGAAKSQVELALWHSVTPVLGMSVVILTAAALLAIAWPRCASLGDRLALTEPLPERPRGLGRLAPERGYRAGLEGVLRLASVQTRILQNGYLRLYITVIVGTAILLTAATVLRTRGPVASGLPTRTPVDLLDAILVLIIVVSGFVAVRASERLAAVAALGALGFSLALLYARYGAPDLAITQVLVDTLTVVLLVFAFYRLPRYARLSSTATRLRDAFVAAIFGGMMAGFTLLVFALEPPSRISTFFNEQAYPAAHGRNVVNTILVDFRALDTLGEITVLGLASIGVLTLLTYRRGERTR